MIPENKATGLDNISAVHSKYASISLFPILAICVTNLLMHGLLPGSMLTVLLVPVIKDKAGKVGSLDNYRPAYCQRSYKEFYLTD